MPTIASDSDEQIKTQNYIIKTVWTEIINLEEI